MSSAQSLRIRIQAIRLMQPDGSKAARITPAELQKWLAVANASFARSGSGLRLAFDPRRDWLVVRDAGLNGLMGGEQEHPDAYARARQLVARHPRKLLVLFRHGDGEGPTGNGFGVASKPDRPGFIAMPGFAVTTVRPDPEGPRLQNDKLFVHELGHFLGLAHTFPDPGPTTPASLPELAQWMDRRGSNPAAFDGDRIADTPPDPLAHLAYHFGGHDYCRASGRLRLNKLDFAPDRHNVMSYFNCPPYRFSQQQIARMHQNLALPTYSFLFR